MIWLYKLKSNTTSLIPHHSNKRFLFALVSVLLLCAYIFWINTPTPKPYSIKSFSLVAVLLFLMLYGFVYSYNTFKKIVLLSIALVTIGLSAQNPKQDGNDEKTLKLEINSSEPLPQALKHLTNIGKTKDQREKITDPAELQKIYETQIAAYNATKQELRTLKKQGKDIKELVKKMKEYNPAIIPIKIKTLKATQKFAEVEKFVKEMDILLKLASEARAFSIEENSKINNDNITALKENSLPKTKAIEKAKSILKRIEDVRVTDCELQKYKDKALKKAIEAKAIAIGVKAKALGENLKIETDKGIFNNLEGKFAEINGLANKAALLAKKVDENANKENSIIIMIANNAQQKIIIAQENEKQAQQKIIIAQENEKQAQQETIIKEENEKQAKESQFEKIQDQVKKRYKKQAKVGTTEGMIDELKKITEQPWFRQTKGISQKAFDDIRKTLMQK